MVTLSGYTMTQGELLYSLPAAVTKNTYTTQAVLSVPSASTLPHCIIPNGYFGSVPSGVGRCLHLKCQGTIANTAAATFTGVLGIDNAQGTLGSSTNGGSVTYWPVLAPTAATTCVWDLDVWMTAQQVGSAGLSLQVNGEYRQSVVASGTLSTAPQSVMFSTTLTGINSEQQYYVELWGTWSASAAGNTTTLQQMRLYGEN